MAGLLPPLLALALAQTAAAPEVHRDLIHADLPLWGSEGETVWPRAFDHADGSFGCASRLRFGDWRQVEGEGDRDAIWHRITNYGAIHCMMMVRDAHAQAELGGRDADPAFLIEIGTAEAGEGPVELWILQRGARPGSDYLLLARRPAPGLIESFDVLQRECPADRRREGQELSILLTGYCAINTQDELIALARRMLLRPPLARLIFVAPEPEED